MFRIKKLIKVLNSATGLVPKDPVYRIFRHISGATKSVQIAHEYNFQRDVLKQAGCSIFTPFDKMELNDDLLQPDPLIDNLIEVIWLFKKNEFNYQSNSSLRQHILPPLDDECQEKSDKWSSHQKLFVMDIWASHLRMKRSKYFNKTLKDFLNEFNTLPEPCALQIMFFISDTKRKITSVDQKNILQKMEQILPQISLNEISIYCLTLFKNEFQIENDKFVRKLFTYLMEKNLMEAHDIAVTCILKALRKYATVVHIKEIKALQAKLLPFAEKTSLMALTHIIQLGFKQRVCNPELVELVIRRYSKNVSDLRLKELERALLIISTFDFRMPTQFEKQFYQIVQSNTDFPLSLIRCVSYLAVSGSITPGLIDHCLKLGDPDKIESALMNLNEIAHNLLIIDSFAKINLFGKYEGKTLSINSVQKLCTLIDKKRSLGHHDYVLKELQQIFKKNGHSFITSKAVPHFPVPDLIFVYNKRTNEAIKLIKSNEMGTILRADDLHQNNPDLVAVVLVSCLQRQTIFNSHKYHGLFQMKLDQLKLLGFKVIVLRRNEWRRNSKNLKQKYLSLRLCQQNIFLFVQPSNLSLAFEKAKSH